MLGRKSEPISENVESLRGFDAFDLQLGDIMRGERATMGKSLLDVQRELKIKANYIAAVENSDPSVFETPGFIAGYVRSYARYLGMDPEWAYDRFCAESGFAGVEGLSGATNAKAIARGKANAKAGSDDSFNRPMAPYIPSGPSLLSQVEPGAIGSVAVLAGLIGLIGYGGWFVLQEVQRVSFAPVDQSPGLVADVSGVGGVDGDADLIAAANTAGSDIDTNLAAPTLESFDRLYRPQALEAPVLTARDGPIASLDPRTTGTFAEDIAQRQASRPASVEPGGVPAPIAPTTPVQVTQAVSPDVMVFAVRPAWVRIASADGTVIFEKILDAGESYTLPQSDAEPLLRAGNSGSLYFNVQGKTFGPAGSGTSVVKSVALGIDAIKSNYVQADLGADPDLAEVMTAMAEAATLPLDDNGASE